MRREIQEWWEEPVLGSTLNASGGRTEGPSRDCWMWRCTHGKLGSCPQSIFPGIYGMKGNEPCKHCNSCSGSSLFLALSPAGIDCNMGNGRFLCLSFHRVRFIDCREFQTSIQSTKENVIRYYSQKDRLLPVIIIYLADPAVISAHGQIVTWRRRTCGPNRLDRETSHAHHLRDGFPVVQSIIFHFSQKSPSNY